RSKLKRIRPASVSIETNASLMRITLQRWFNPVLLTAILGFTPVTFVRAADSLSWHTRLNEVDAQIESWPLPKVLESIASATGWQIYVEPDTHYTVTTRFRKLNPADALKRLLGELNFALLPQTNGPAKLFIYRSSVHDATQLIRAARKSTNGPSSRPVPNELVVRLKPGARETIDALAKRLGEKVTGRIDGLNAN